MTSTNLCLRNGFDQDGMTIGVGEALVNVAVMAPSALADGAGEAALEQAVAVAKTALTALAQE